MRFAFLWFAAMMKFAAAIECYSCMFSNTTTNVVQLPECGDDFIPEEITKIPCFGVCFKSQAITDIGRVIIRGCKDHSPVTRDTCRTSTSPESTVTFCYTFYNLRNTVCAMVSQIYVLIVAALLATASFYYN